MSTTLYNPFDSFLFDTRHCFLTGKPLTEAGQMRPVFPEWIMKEYQLFDKPLQMLDETVATYGSLSVPVSSEIAARLFEIDETVRHAFESGEEAVRALDQRIIFHWIGTWFYGVIFNEIQAGVRQAAMTGEDMNFSQSLIHKFRNLHYMLQSISLDMEFEHFNPFQTLVWGLSGDEDEFSYRDEVNTLVFSLKMKGVGLVACLQDNGTNAKYHEELLSKIAGKKLHPIQFEEVSARFYYSAYLFNRLPEYTFLDTPECVFVEGMPLNDFSQKPIFDEWIPKTYSQVLENFWKPWGIIYFEIMKDPENPISFLLDTNREWKEIDKRDIPEIKG